jgi:prevent-host-death family protein
MKQPTYSIQAGNFKAKCLQLMDEVHDKHISIIITKHGVPVAKLTPIDDTPVDFFGCLKNTVTIKKDITSPIDVSWEANE